MSGKISPDVRRPQATQSRENTTTNPWRLAALIGVGASVLSVLGSWTPSYWSDEVASLRATRLSWTALFEFTGHIDGVHAAYYSLLKLWTGAFGESEIATRSLSALSVGVATVGVVRLVWLLSTMPAAVTSGLIFAVLPRTTYLGIEARPFALGMALAVWTTVALIVAIRLTRWRWWALYAALAAVAIYVFLYTALLLPAHLCFVLALRQRGDLKKWLVVAACALGAATPLFLIALRQRRQIAWLSDQPAVNPWSILGAPVFETSWLVAAIAWAALVLLGLRRRAILSGRDRGLFLLAAAWLIVPTIMLLAADAVVGPLYTGRYLAFTAPAMAILLTMSIRRWAKRSFAWVLVAVIVVASLPTYVEQRSPLSKNDGSDLAQISEYIAVNSKAGDGVYLEKGNHGGHPRQALYAYPTLFNGLEDIAFEESFVSTRTFADRTSSIEDLPTLLDHVDRLWVVTVGGSNSVAATRASTILARAGLTSEASYLTNRSLITLYKR